jgi:hypothetical protein
MFSSDIKWEITRVRLIWVREPPEWQAPPFPTLFSAERNDQTTARLNGQLDQLADLVCND